MTEAIKKFVCKMNLRPVKGAAKLILAGTPFDASILDEHSRKVFLERGDLTEHVPDYIDTEATDVPQKPVAKTGAKEQIANLKADALEKFNVELKGRSLNDVKAAYAEAEAAATENSPHGIFNKTAEELEDMNLDELDAVHADICADNELPAPDPFKDEEEAVAKLTSEA
jgi:hypothetical protein